jgi:hypothetical protein
MYRSVQKTLYYLLLAVLAIAIFLPYILFGIWSVRVKTDLHRFPTSPEGWQAYILLICSFLTLLAFMYFRVILRYLKYWLIHKRK